MNDLIKKYGLRFGLINGSLAVLYSMIAFLFDESLFVSFWLGIVLFLVYFTFMILALLGVRKEQEGYITFKEAFSAFTFTGIIHIGITLVFNLLLFLVIDPELGDRIIEMTAERTGAMMERFGNPEEIIDEAVARIREGNNYSFLNLLKGSLFTIMFIAVLGLIVAAFTKRPKPIFEESLSEEL